MIALPLLLAIVSAAPKPQPPPATPRRPVAETLHGVTVTDPYRWIENKDDPAVAAWTKAQDARTRAYLDGFPRMAALRNEVRRLLVAAAGVYVNVEKRGDRYFALRVQPPRQQPFLVTLSSLENVATERSLLDPVALDPSGATTIDWFEPSTNGALVAVSLSKRGTESGDVHVFDAVTGKEVGDVIPRVNGGTAGGGLAWAEGSAGFWYTRYPAAGERPEPDLPFFQEVWFHRLGTPVSEDRYETGREFPEPRIAEHFLQATDDGRFVLDLVQKGDGREFELYVRAPDGRWNRVAGLGDGIIAARLGLDGGLWLLSVKDEPRGRILRLPLGATDLSKARVIATGTRGAFQGHDPTALGFTFEVTAARLYVSEIEGGPSTIHIYDLDGKALGDAPAAPISAVRGIRRVGEHAVLYGTTSYVAPLTWWSLEDGASSSRKLAISSKAAIDFSDVEVVREETKSRDGTRVPMTILFRKGTKRNGKNPALLTGYGGYGVSEVPSFSTNRRLLLDAGFVLAFANIRGGGEYGESWHRGGNLVRKQNGFDDFAACARHLVTRRYTRPSRLSLLGGSNGGLLMGAQIVQHPEEARAVVAEVGIFDMIRVEDTPNGAFNVTEFGTVKDPSEFRALYAYSPYHHVKDGTKYPAVLLTAGENDPRVDSWHAKKMAARLQAATRSGLPVLLRVSGFGHGMGTPLDERVAEYADVDAFLFLQLGVSWKPPPAAPADEAAIPVKPADAR